MSKLFDFTIKLNDGREAKLEEFRGKKILLVNTASHCGFTSQYQELQDLFLKFQDRLMVIAFPCNQFGAQEPGSSDQIASFCQDRFGISFPVTEKIEVNGSDANPLFKYVTEQLPGVMGIRAVKWNFTKFLFDEEGRAVKRFASATSPNKIARYI